MRTEKMPISDNKLLRATLQKKYLFLTDLQAPGNKMVLVAFPFMNIFCMVIFSFLKVSIKESIVSFKALVRHDIRERMQKIMRGKTIHDHGFGKSFVSSESFVAKEFSRFRVTTSPHLQSILMLFAEKWKIKLHLK